MFFRFISPGWRACRSLFFTGLLRFACMVSFAGVSCFHVSLLVRRDIFSCCVELCGLVWSGWACMEAGRVSMDGGRARRQHNASILTMVQTVFMV